MFSGRTSKLFSAVTVGTNQLIRLKAVIKDHSRVLNLEVDEVCKMIEDERAQIKRQIFQKVQLNGAIKSSN